MIELSTQYFASIFVDMTVFSYRLTSQHKLHDRTVVELVIFACLISSMLIIEYFINIRSGSNKSIYIM